MSTRRYITALVVIAVVGAIGYIAWEESPFHSKRTNTKVPPLPTANSMTKPEEETAYSILATRGNDGLLEAVERYKRATATTPIQLSAYNNLGTAYALLGRVSEAEGAFNAGLAKSAELPAETLSRPEYRNDCVLLRTSLAHILLTRGEFAEAQKLLEQAVALVPRDAAAHNNLANALLLQQKFDAAGPHYDMATALQPDNPETFCNWGVMLFQADRPREAEGKLRQAIALKKDVARYHYWLGRALRKQGFFGPAMKEEEEALQIDPKMPEALLEVADMLVELKHYREAESHLRAALSVSPDNLNANVALARLLLATNDPAQRSSLEAALLFRKACELTHEQDVNLLTQLADSYALSGFYEQAHETLEKAIVLAKEQKLSGVDMELLLQHNQEYIFLENRTQVPSENTGSPLSVEGGEHFLHTEPPANPYEASPTARSKPITVRKVTPP